MRFIPLILATALLASCAPQQQQQAHLYHVAKAVPVAGAGGWDYVAVDAQARRVYVSHTTQVDVLDADSAAPVGVIPHLHGVHGIAIASDLGRGFITNGKTDSVTLFDLKTLDVLGQVKTGSKPDSIVYDPFTRRVFAFNGESDSATVIDARRGRKVGTIKLGGGPEFAVADGKGHVFVNLEDTNELLRLDAKRLTVLDRWPVIPGTSPSSLAMDRGNGRLFIGCRNRQLMVMNAENGSILASLPLGEHVDATAFDAATQRIISSNGDGTLTIIHEDSADRYHALDTVLTQISSRTFGLDEKTHRLFVPAAQFAVATPSPDNPKGRPTVIPGTFRILVLEP